MKKQQYKAVVRAQKEASKPAKKLIHLIINYRSHEHARYPKDFLQIIRQIKSGSKLFDYDGLWYFYQLEGDRWRQPRFYSPHYGNAYRPIETDLPF